MIYLYTSFNRTTLKGVTASLLKLIDMNGLSLYTIIHILFLLLIKQSPAGFEIDKFTRIRIDAATEIADMQHESDQTMDPPELRNDSFPRLDKKWINDPSLYCVLPYTLFDPLCQFNALLDGNTLSCPKCKAVPEHKSCERNILGHLVNTRVWKNGRLERLNPRVIFDLTSPALLVYKQYSCTRGHREINAVDVDILQQINFNVPFTISHKSGFTNRLVDYLEELLDTGLSSSQIGQMIQRCYNKAYYERAQRYYHDYKIAKHKGITSEGMKNFPSFEQMDLPCVGHQLVDGAIISRFMLEEALYQQYFSTIPARWISCDHTFKSVSNIGYLRKSDKKWVKLFQSLFCVLNEKGTVIQWKFTKTEGTAELENVFRQLSQRFISQNIVIEGIFLDNCCKWTQFLGKYFPGVCIKLDIFHAVQRLVRKIPKRSKYSSVMSKEYGLVFRQPGDIGKKRSASSPSADVILENLEKFTLKWESVINQSGTSVFIEEMLKKPIKVHIKKGCLSDIPVGSGTNGNERLHRDMKKVVATNRIGPPLLYTKMFRMLYKLAKENKNEMPTIHKMKAHAQEGIRGTELRRRLETFGVERSLKEIEIEDNQEMRKVNRQDEFLREEKDTILNGLSILEKS